MVAAIENNMGTDIQEFNQINHTIDEIGKYIEEEMALNNMPLKRKQNYIPTTNPKIRKILYHSEVCPANNTFAPNLRAYNWGDNDHKDDHGIICPTIDVCIEIINISKPLKIIEIINTDKLIGYTISPTIDVYIESINISTINIYKLFGCTFEMPNQDGELYKSTIT